MMFILNIATYTLLAANFQRHNNSTYHVSNVTTITYIFKAYSYLYVSFLVKIQRILPEQWAVKATKVCNNQIQVWHSLTRARFLSLARSKLRLCSANHRPGYWSNLPCDWLSTAWAYSEQETENRPWLWSHDHFPSNRNAQDCDVFTLCVPHGFRCYMEQLETPFMIARDR